jgi:hypothetical protein
MATTTNFGWTKPTVGGSTDTWGTENNTDWDNVDAELGRAGFTIVIDGGGLATGIKLDIVMPYDGTINSVTALADQSGSIVIDAWKDSYSNFPPTDADSITASAPITISTATKSQDSTLTGWTNTFTEGQIIRLNVDSCSTITRVTLHFDVTRT